MELYFRLVTLPSLVSEFGGDFPVLLVQKRVLIARSAYYVGDGSKIVCWFVCLVWFVRNFGDFCGRDMEV